MTDRLTGKHRTTTGMQDTIRWVNVAGEPIPAYGVVQFRSNYASNFSQAAKPDGAAGLFYVNGGTPIADGLYGESRVWSRPQLVLIDGAPTVGDEVGPVDGEWFMSADGTGYRVIHQAVDGVGSVVQVGGGGVQVAWGDLAADSGPDDVLVSMNIYASAKPTTFAEVECGGEPFIHMRWTLCDEIGTSLVAVPAFYKAGPVGLVKFPDCDPGTDTTDGAAQAWEGWCVVFGDRARCAATPVNEVECCPITQEIMVTERLTMRYIGDLGDPILTPCPTE